MVVPGGVQGGRSGRIEGSVADGYGYRTAVVKGSVRGCVQAVGGCALMAVPVVMMRRNLAVNELRLVVADWCRRGDGAGAW